MKYRQLMKFQCPNCERCWESLRDEPGPQPCPFCFNKSVKPGHVNAVLPLHQPMRLPECRHDPLEPTTCETCQKLTETEAWLWACELCGCTDIEDSVWQEVNTGYFVSECLDEFWCPQCDTQIKTVEQRAAEQPYKDEREQKAEGL